MRAPRLLAATAALFIAVLPAGADQLLGPGRIVGSDTANGDIVFGNLKIGRMLGGKKVLQPDAIQIQGSGSTGDASGMSVVPPSGVPAGTATRTLGARMLDRYTTSDAGADPTGTADAGPAFQRGLSAFRPFDVLPGTYNLQTAPPIGQGVPFFSSGTKITGASSYYFGGSSGIPYWGWIDPATQQDKGIFYWHQPGQMRQLATTKIASGAQAGNGSDQHYAAFLNTYLDDVVQTDPNNWFAVNSFNNFNQLIRGESLPVRGSGVSQFNGVFVKDINQSNPLSYNGESEAINNTVIAGSNGNNGGHNWWGMETNVRGSATGASRMIVGHSIVVQNPHSTTINPATGYVGSAGQTIHTAPEIATFPTRPGDTFAGMTLSPIDVGLSVAGYSGNGTIQDGYDAGADYGFLVGLDVGGGYGPWSLKPRNGTTTGFWRSKIKEGVNVQSYTDAGIHLFGAHPSAGANMRSLRIDANAGSVQIDSAANFGGGVALMQFTPTLVLQDNGAPSGQNRVALQVYQGSFAIQRQGVDGSYLSNPMVFSADGSTITMTGSILAPTLPTSGGTVKGTVCIDTTGKFYTKTTSGACL